MSYLELDGNRHAIPAGESVIGSDASSLLALEGPGIAPRHLVVVATADGQTSVRRATDDAETYINGVLLGPQPAPLLHGDKIEVGGREFSFVDERRAGNTAFVSVEEIARLQAVGAKHAGQSQETLAYITVQFEDNIIGHVHVNWLAPAKIRQVIVGGSKRMCIYDDNEPSEKIKVYDKGVELKSIEGIHSALVQYRLGDMHAPALPNAEALARATVHFAHCIKSHTQPITDGRAGLAVVQVLEAAQQSMAEQGRRVYFVDPRREDPAKHYQDKLVQLISSPTMVR